MISVVDNGISGCYPRRVVTDTSVINIFWEDILLVAVEDIRIGTFISQQSELGVTGEKNN